ncbi:unnamed protein product [Dovyalis caffra]|uniref:Polygalacturonase n=1 Tax=Dovyalis caffra TaxID=77055 RepID=A0AAV1SBI1_9ROSI|nr:unnamed protein product [Dovyalis caffra]
MAIVGSILVLGLALLCSVADGALRQRIGLSHHRRSLIDGSGGAVTVFDVTQHGAKADDRTDNAEAFIQTWRLACDSSVPAKLVIPKGTFLTSPVVFQGPCNGTEPQIFEIQGTVKATTDLSEYSSPEWILFERINGFTLNGGGAFDGQGSAVWKYNDCHRNKECQPLPSPSQVKISDVHYKNIKGTSTSAVAVNFLCSSLVPCEGLELVDIDLAYVGAKANMPLSSSCLNAHFTSGGKQNPPRCP